MADQYNSAHTGAEIDQAVSDVQNNKAAWSSKPQPSTTIPKAPGTASAGSENAYARGDHVHPDNDAVHKTGDESISGVKTFEAPENMSGIEQTTTKFTTSNGGAVIIGKEGDNSGTMLRFDQVDGTTRLRFRASAAPGAMVWEQPEEGAVLYIDLGARGVDHRRITFPTSGWGTLAYQESVDSKVPKTRKINDHDLSADITLTASDVDALPADALPAVTTADNGKFMRVVDGAWAAANGSGPTQYTGTLLASGWAADAHGYQAQTIVITGLKASYDVDPQWDVALSGTDPDADAALLEGFALIHNYTTGVNSLTAQCIGKAPTVNIPVKVVVFG